MRRVAVVGAGMTPFAEHFDLGIKDLVPMAVSEAVARVDSARSRRSRGVVLLLAAERRSNRSATKSATLSIS